MQIDQKDDIELWPKELCSSVFAEVSNWSEISKVMRLLDPIYLKLKVDFCVMEVKLVIYYSQVPVNTPFRLI
jgi:hypothetical protein